MMSAVSRCTGGAEMIFSAAMLSLETALRSSCGRRAGRLVDAFFPNLTPETLGVVLRPWPKLGSELVKTSNAIRLSPVNRRRDKFVTPLKNATTETLIAIAPLDVCGVDFAVA